MTEYRFDHAFPADHFVTKYIEYASELTDAAHEYHEACALALLALATPDVRAPISQFPNGLKTNLYMSLVGSTSISRKSTAKNIAKDIAGRVWPASHLNEKATPEAFAQDLGAKTGSSLWCVDEFAQQLIQMHKRDFMAGMSGLLLELYGGDDYTYSRTKTPVTIRDPHLTIIGCTADTIFDKLHEDDIASGLLPRFAIVYPSRKPERKPFFETNANLGAHRNALVYTLNALSPVRDVSGHVITPRAVRFSSDAMRTIDTYAAAHEQQHDGELFRRLVPMGLKVAVLAALGGTAFRMNTGTIVVEEDDARCALIVVDRWTISAKRFQAQLGENRIEKLITRALEFSKRKAKSAIARRTVARHLHVDSRTMLDVEKTLLDRELIELVQDANKVKCWRLLTSDEEEVAS